MVGEYDAQSHTLVLHGHGLPAAGATACLCSKRSVSLCFRGGPVGVAKI